MNHKKHSTETTGKTIGKTTGTAGLRHLPTEPILRGRAGLVVFSAEIGAWWSRFLPRPWRHCFVLFALVSNHDSTGDTGGVGDTGGKPQGWLLLDPCHGRTELSWLSPATGARLLNRVLLGGQAAVVPYAPQKAPQMASQMAKHSAKHSPRGTELGFKPLRLGLRILRSAVRSLAHSLAHSLPLGGCVWQVQQVLGIPALSFSPSGLYRRLATIHHHKKYFSADTPSFTANNKKYFPNFHKKI